MVETSFETAGGMTVHRRDESVDYDTAINGLINSFNDRRGALFSSNYEYPGRYTRWDTAFIDPPLVMTATGRAMRMEALNERGILLVDAIADAVEGNRDVASLRRQDGALMLQVCEPDRIYVEEERSRAPTVFSVLRAVVDLFRTDEDSELGLYGAFGYDLAFQFDPVELKITRPSDQRDMVLFLPDELLIVDHYTVTARRLSYDFTRDSKTTKGIARKGTAMAFKAATEEPPRGDHQPGEYAALVRKAKEKFRRGDLFEVVPGQVFYARCAETPADIYRRLRAINPSPYSFFMNLGEQEYLVGASPEMFVRVTGRRVETCPISGTIRRGEDAIEDSEQILKLLNSKKDESELTMCSDVDRNDKSRVCEPGSVRVIGRRQIEMYSRLIHTVDHIEGRLRADKDAFDAFLSHAWAVTVTGAPKLWAMRFIEAHEKSPRAWYGGAVGMVHFNGNMNTGLTLRTIHIKDGRARVRAGATLLNDSDPDEEERETELKASAMLDAIRGTVKPAPVGMVSVTGKGTPPRRVLLIDHEDSFVHTLAGYFRQAGVDVKTIRTPVPDDEIDAFAPHLVVLSPGPGTPADFDCATTIARLKARSLPIFGVCLGLQAIAEAHGAMLDQLDEPMHGKPSRIRVAEEGRIFAGLPREITVGRYHSLYVKADTMPPTLRATAFDGNGVIMALEHVSEPIAAVQFHPESIMSLAKDVGIRMVANVIDSLAARCGRR